MGTLCGAGTQEKKDKQKAVQLGIAEYYLDSNSDKQFHYYIEPKQ